MSIFVYIAMHAFALFVLFDMISFIVEGHIWFPALFLGLWFTVLFVISSSFWHPLLTAFPARHDRKLRRYYMVNAIVGRCRLVLNVTVGELGLTLAAVPMFRPFHPPIHVPWTEVDIAFPSSRVTRVVFTRRDFPDLYLFRRLGIDGGDNARSR
jgi:hypothetical protein